MKWLMLQKLVARELSDQVKAPLIAQFTLNPQMVEKMRFSGKRGRYAIRPVKYIRIYDPALIQRGETTDLSYDGLAQIPGHRQALLFEGRIEANRRVSLTDLRTPALLFPLS